MTLSMFLLYQVSLSYDVSLIPGILLYHTMFRLTRYLYHTMFLLTRYLYHMMFLLYQVYYFIIGCFSYTRYITLSYDVSLIPGILLYHMMFLLYQVYDFII